MTALLLTNQLRALAPRFASAAQTIYDQWEADDEELNGGGICDRIAEAMQEIVGEAIPRVHVETSYDEEFGHTSLLVLLPPGDGRTVGQAAALDIPASVYEIGAFYQWEKIPGVTFTADHVVVMELRYEDVAMGYVFDEDA